MTTGESNTIQLASTQDGNTINISSTEQDRAIEGVDDDGDKVDEVGDININSIKASKLVMSKDLV